MVEHPGGGDSIHQLRVPYEPIPARILFIPLEGDAERFPVTYACLKQYCWDSVLPIDPLISEEDKKYGMWEQIKEAWTANSDLIHIDHDMVFTWENLRDLVNCDSDWCVCPSISLGIEVDGGLGFVKFGETMQYLIDPQDIDWSLKNCDYCKGEWWGVEWHIVQTILENGWIRPCVHTPVLNDHPQYGLYGESGFC